MLSLLYRLLSLFKYSLVFINTEMRVKYGKTSTNLTAGDESLNNLVSQIAEGLFTTLNTQTFLVNCSGQNALTQANTAQ